MKTSSLSILTDHQLVGLLRAGDESAYAEIWRRYFDLLTSVASGAVAAARREDARDIVQEVFLYMWVSRERLPVIESLRSYLYHAVKHKLYNYFRFIKTRREHHEVISQLSLGSCQPHFANDNPEIKLNHHLSKLPARCRVAFEASRIREKNIREISESMMVDTRTVENYITTALHVLREAYKVG